MAFPRLRAGYHAERAARRQRASGADRGGLHALEVDAGAVAGVQKPGDRRGAPRAAGGHCRTVWKLPRFEAPMDTYLIIGLVSAFCAFVILVWLIFRL